MEIKQERKQEIVNEILGNIYEDPDGKKIISSFYINKNKTSLTVDELDFMKSKLLKFTNVVEDEKEVGVKNIDDMLSQAHQDKALSQIIKATTQGNDSAASAVLLNGAAFPTGMNTTMGVIGAYGAGQSNNQNKYFELEALLNHEFGLETKVEQSFEMQDKQKAVGFMGKFRSFLTGNSDNSNKKPKM